MVVKSGTTTTATLQLDSEASGPALLLIGHAPAGGAAQSDVASVPPGGTATVSLTPVGFGIMRVHVDLSDDVGDRAVLTVSPAGPSAQALQGDSNFRYTVVDSVSGDPGTLEPDN